MNEQHPQPRVKRQSVRAFDPQPLNVVFSKDFNHDAANALEVRVYYVETTHTVYKAHDLRTVMELFVSEDDNKPVLRVGSVG